MKWLAQCILKLCGWKTVGVPPSLSKYVIVLAPHTSNWDLFVGLAYRAIYGFKAYWMAKHTLFVWPVAGLLRALGGVAVDRRSQHNTVSQVVDRYTKSDSFILTILPEGTRSWREHWKSGFYQIALGAKVPLVLGFFDYKKREVGIGPVVELTGDVKNDMQVLREFYEPLNAKFPEKKGPIQLRDE